MDNYLKEEEQLREAELYEEMKDLKKLKKILKRKERIFAQRRFKLRGLVLDNLKRLTKKQLKALDEEYKLIGLDEECWIDEEHFLHDLERKIVQSKINVHTKEQKENIIEKDLLIENKEESQVQLLILLIKQYVHILYNELIEINTEDLLHIKNMLLQEQRKISEIGKIIKLEELEEENVVKDNL